MPRLDLNLELFAFLIPYSPDRFCFPDTALWRPAPLLKVNLICCIRLRFGFDCRWFCWFSIFEFQSASEMSERSWLFFPALLSLPTPTVWYYLESELVLCCGDPLFLTVGISIVISLSKELVTMDLCGFIVYLFIMNWSISFCWIGLNTLKLSTLTSWESALLAACFFCDALSRLLSSLASSGGWTSWGDWY